METVFWGTFWAAAFGAGFAFLLASLKDSYDRNHEQIAALLRAQINLMEQMRRLKNYDAQYIRPAKTASGKSSTAMLIPFSDGVFPESVDLDSLAFLLDRRVMRKAYDFKSMYLEVLSANKRFERQKSLICRFEDMKAEIVKGSKVLRISQDSASETPPFETLYSENDQTLVLLCDSVIEEVQSLR